MVDNESPNDGDRGQAFASQIQLFNLESMAGVSPGTRTQRFQRVQLLPLEGESDRPVWAQVLWYDDPPSCVVFLPGRDGRPSPEPLVRIAEPDGSIHHVLSSALHQVGWFLQSCGLCRHWQPQARRTADGFAAGRCGWGVGDRPASVLALQSALALRCPHWEPLAQPASAPPEPAPANQIEPLRKIAEISESKLPFWRRLLRRVRPMPVPSAWEEKLAERSGVGAGTEPCFACQGRIANLGALAVETDEGDTQTLSVWRCRVCCSTYLNDWIDRWVRLDNLETEERYYRIAPSEAVELLNRIYDVQGGEHPARRRERVAQREYFLQFIAGRTPLSHQIRQGR